MIAELFHNLPGSVKKR